MANFLVAFKKSPESDLQVIFEGSRAECRRFVDAQKRKLAGKPAYEMQIHYHDQFLEWVKNGYAGEFWCDPVEVSGRNDKGKWIDW